MTNQEYATMLRAIRDHAGLELSTIRDAGNHGADAGFGGFTYTVDGAEFYRANADTIDAMLQDDAEAFGYDDVATLISNFGRADMADTRDGRDCLLAWYALEETGRFPDDEGRGQRAAAMSRPAFSEDLVTAGEFAALCGVTPQALSNWARRGVGPGRPPLPPPWAVLGKVLLFHQDDVDEFLSEYQANRYDTAEKLRARAAALIRRADRMEEQ